MLGCPPQTPVPPSIPQPPPSTPTSTWPSSRESGERLPPACGFWDVPSRGPPSSLLLSPSARGSRPHCFLSLARSSSSHPKLHFFRPPSDSPRNFPSFSFPTAHLPCSCRHPAILPLPLAPSWPHPLLLSHLAPALPHLLFLDGVRVPSSPRGAVSSRNPLEGLSGATASAFVLPLAASPPTRRPSARLHGANRALWFGAAPGGASVILASGAAERRSEAWRGRRRPSAGTARPARRGGQVASPRATVGPAGPTDGHALLPCPLRLEGEGPRGREWVLLENRSQKLQSPPAAAFQLHARWVWPRRRPRRRPLTA